MKPETTQPPTSSSLITRLMSDMSIAQAEEGSPTEMSFQPTTTTNEKGIFTIHKSKFLSLPRELRDMIYLWIVADAIDIQPSRYPGLRTAWTLSVHQNGDRWHLPDGLPDLRIRQSCTMVKEEVDNCLSNFMYLECHVLIPPTPSYTLPPCTLTTKSLPAVLYQHVGRLALFCRFPGSQDEWAQVPWQWLGSLTNMREGLCVVIYSPIPRVKPSATCYSLRGLVADICSNLPVAASMEFEETTKNRMMIYPNEYWVERKVLRCIGRDMQPLQGTSIVNDPIEDDSD